MDPAIRGAKSRSLCRLMHDLASYHGMGHKFSPGADLHNVRSPQRMHEWHAREGMQFVPALAARFCTGTENRRSCRGQNTRKCSEGHGEEVDEVERGGQREGRKTERTGRCGGREKEREDDRESKERSRTLDKGALPSSASLNRT